MRFIGQLVGVIQALAESNHDRRMMAFTTMGRYRLVKEILSSLFVPWDIMGLRSPGYLQICAKMGLWSVDESYFKNLATLTELEARRKIESWKTSSTKWLKNDGCSECLQVECFECFDLGSMLSGLILQVVQPLQWACQASRDQRQILRRTSTMDNGRTGATWDCKTAVQIRNA